MVPLHSWSPCVPSLAPVGKAIPRQCWSRGQEPLAQAAPPDQSGCYSLPAEKEAQGGQRSLPCPAARPWDQPPPLPGGGSNLFCLCDTPARSRLESAQREHVCVCRHLAFCLRTQGTRWLRGRSEPSTRRGEEAKAQGACRRGLETSCFFVRRTWACHPALS